MGKRIVTPSDLSKIFGVSTKTVLAWTKANKLPAPLPGFRKRWRWEDIQHLVGTVSVDK